MDLSTKFHLLGLAAHENPYHCLYIPSKEYQLVWTLNLPTLLINYPNAAYMPSFFIIFGCNEGCSCIFRLPISFIKGTRHENFHKLENLFSYGSTSCNHIPDSPSKTCFCLWKNNFIIKPWLIISIFMKLLTFRFNSPIKKASFDTSCFWYLAFNCLLDSVIYSWNCHKNSRFYKSTIILNFRYISIKKSNYRIKLHCWCTKVHNSCLHHSLKDMR